LPPRGGKRSEMTKRAKKYQPKERARCERRVKALEEEPKLPTTWKTPREPEEDHGWEGVGVKKPPGAQKKHGPAR